MNSKHKRDKTVQHVILIIIGTMMVPVAYILYLLFPLVMCRPFTVDLPNGYRYMPDNSGHRFGIDRSKGDFGELGLEGQYRFAFVHRIYVGRRYVVGEVMPYEDKYNGEPFNYFIIDTVEHTTTGEISSTEYEQQLQALGIANKVRLRKRNNWWRASMCFQYGLTDNNF